MSKESTSIQMRERVVLAKFDHTEEDCPTVPCEVITQETVTEISLDEATLLGFKPKVEATATVQSEGPRVSD